MVCGLRHSQSLVNDRVMTDLPLFMAPVIHSIAVT